MKAINQQEREDMIIKIMRMGEISRTQATLIVDGAINQMKAEDNFRMLKSIERAYENVEIPEESLLARYIKDIKKLES